MRAIEQHQKLRRRQDRLQTMSRSLEAEVQSAHQTKLLIEMNLQVFRQAEWEANHPVRNAPTQVHDFQPQQHMTLPVIVLESPASPEYKPPPHPKRMASPAIAPVPRKVCSRDNGQMVAVVHGYTHQERAFIDSCRTRAV